MTLRRPGTWLAVFLLITALGLSARLIHLASSRGTPRQGDGRAVASYGFDLTFLALPHGELMAAGMPRDGAHALTLPPAWSAERMDAQRQQRRAPRLVPSDLVIGVVRAGQARAYPLRFLVWHEVVNDEIAGEPVLVVHHALSGLSAVFARRLADGRTPTFGVSGLVWNSGPILYDRTPGRESLWSPFLARAVAGRAAQQEASLELLPSQLATWGEWRTRHPDTTVLAPDPALSREYRREPFGSYLGSDLLRFPAEPTWPHEAVPRKTLTLVVPLAPGRFLAVTHPAAAALAGPRATTARLPGEPPIGVRLTSRPPTLALDGEDQSSPSLTAFAFAWYAAHPRDTNWVLPEGSVPSPRGR